MADKPPKGRTARTRTAGKAPQPPPPAAAASNEPTVLDAEAFTHGGVPKAKFAPKVPARRLKKLSAVKKEDKGNAEAEMSSELLKLVKQSKEDLARRGPGADKKSAPVRVAFGFGGSAATARSAAFEEQTRKH